MIKKEIPIVNSIFVLKNTTKGRLNRDPFKKSLIFPIVFYSKLGFLAIYFSKITNTATKIQETA